MGTKKQHQVTALLLAGIMMLSAPAVCAEEIATPETATPETAVTYDMPVTAALLDEPVVQADTPDYSKGDASCEIEQGTFTKSDSKYYGSATFYDYYGDNERQGTHISQLTVGALGKTDGWHDQNAFQWNDAIDAYFNGKEIDPLYFGGARFFNNAGAASGKRNTLYNWTEYRTYGNGSVGGNRVIVGDGAYFPNQGIAAKKLDDNDQLLLNTADGTIAAPYFSKTFVRNGETNPNGYVYENVSFPFTRDTDSETWLFDSTKNGAQLKQDTTSKAYYIADNGNPVSYAGKPYFFPFNTAGDSIGENDAYKLNYMFGMRLELPFNLRANRLTESGNHTVFRFAGDDDIWVYIDGKLVLDMGGSHGTVAGAIDFTTGKYMVSGKWGGTASEKAYAMSNTEFWTATAKGFGTNDAKDFLKQKVGNYNVSDLCTVGDLKDIFDGDLTTGVRHTIQIFYMERGWDQSNLKMSFNFSQNSSVAVTKTTDVSPMEPARDFLGEDVTNAVQQKLLDQAFTFTVQNQKTTNNNTIMQNSPLAPAIKKKYLLNNTEYALANDGKGNATMKLKNGDSAVFTDQFDYDSYLQVSEQLEDDRFTPLWSLTETDYQGQQHIITKRQAQITDTAIPDALKDVPGTTPYDERVCTINTNETVPRDPAEQKSLLLRPYSTGSSKVNLQIDFTNKLNVGTLTLQKQLPGGQTPPEDSSFTLLVLFSNIGGTDINKEDAVEVELNAANNYTQKLEGIPYGTAYTVYEVQQDGWTLVGMTPNGQPADVETVGNQPVYAKCVTGTVNSRQPNATVVFTNRKDEPKQPETPATETPSTTPTPTPKPAAPTATPAPQTTATPQPTPAAVQAAAIPQTSDPMPVGVLVLLAGLSFAGMALCVLRRRKANHK